MSIITDQQKRLQRINRTRLEIKELRRRLGIDDHSILNKIKQRLPQNKYISPNSEGNRFTDKSTELDFLTNYKIRLVKLSKILFFMPFITYIIDLLLFLINYPRSSFIKKQLTIPQNTIIVFGAIPYTYRYQRPQHLAYELSKKGWRILYVELIRSSFPSMFVNKIQDNIFNILMSATNNPNLTMELPSDTNKKEIISFVKQLRLTKKTVFKIDHPFWSFIREEFKNTTLYDCMDDHDSFDVSTSEFADKERGLAVKSSLVIASSDSLKQKMEKYGVKQTVLLKNACEYNLFSKNVEKTPPIPEDIKNLRGKIIGYYGAIAEWFDDEIIEKLAQKFSNDSIVLIGQVSHTTLKTKIAYYKNVHLLGEKPYNDLPRYLQMFDVCLIPFVINNLTRATNPVKIYEYFASGKPIVATMLPELNQFKDLVYLANDPEDFALEVKNALNEKKGVIDIRRIQTAKENTWEKRGEHLNKILTSLENLN